MPDEPEVAGLLALRLLIESRRASRIRPTARWCCSASRTTRAGIVWQSERLTTSCAGARNATNLVTINCRPPSTPCTPMPRVFGRPPGRRLLLFTIGCLRLRQRRWLALNRAVAIGDVPGSAARSRWSTS
jgi:RNA polymerase sigma-70 factor, ECF subfamily